MMMVLVTYLFLSSETSTSLPEQLLYCFATAKSYMVVAAFIAFEASVVNYNFVAIAVKTMPTVSIEGFGIIDH